MAEMPARLRQFLFPVDSGRWLGILRVGLGVQLVFYALSLGRDWFALFGASHGLVSRSLTEAILSDETIFTPRLGWLVGLGHHVGLSENSTLTLVWVGLVAVGCSLILGVFCRPCAVLAWFLHLATVKSGLLFAYGVDYFTTIGLFYLMVAPFPDDWSLDRVLRQKPKPNAARLGFHRRALQLHLCLIYFFSGVSKFFSVDWWNGESVWRALTRPPFNSLPAESLIHFHSFFPLLGIAVCVLEAGYVVFIWSKRTRYFWLAGILLLHLSIGLLMGLYLFASIMIVLNLSAFGSELLTPVGPVVRFVRRRLVHEHSVGTRETR